MLELYHNDMSTSAQKMRFDEERVISHPLIQKAVRSILLCLPDIHPATHVGTIFVCLQANGTDTVNRQFLITIFGVPRYPDRAHDITIVRSDEHAAAFRKYLVVGRAQEVPHEGRLLLVADSDEARRSAERQRGIGLPISDEHAAAFRKYLVVGRAQEVPHEGRLLLVADSDEARRSAERQRGIGLP